MFSGKMEAIEKVDGQNIQMSIKDGKVICARSTKHLKEFGKNAIPVENIKDFFSASTPQEVRDVYYNAMMSLNSQRTAAIDKFFDEGKVWINAEIIHPDTTNVIVYETSEIVVHNYFRVDENGKKIEDVDEAIHLDYYYPGKLSFAYIHNSETSTIFDRLKIIMLKHNLRSGNTIADYIKASYKKDLKIAYPILTEDLINAFAHRWATGDKKIRINTLLKNTDAVTKLILKDEEAKSKHKVKDYMSPIIQLIMDAGILTLRRLRPGSLLAPEVELTTQKTKERVDEAYRSLFGLLSDPEVKAKNENLSEYIQLYRQAGGTNSVMPIEGFVFKLDEHTYKIQGIFHAALQIYGAVKYGNLK